VETLKDSRKNIRRRHSWDLKQQILTESIESSVGGQDCAGARYQRERGAQMASLGIDLLCSCHASVS